MKHCRRCKECGKFIINKLNHKYCCPECREESFNKRRLCRFIKMKHDTATDEQSLFVGSGPRFIDQQFKLNCPIINGVKK